jgi:hypothetical protein
VLFGHSDTGRCDWGSITKSKTLDATESGDTTPSLPPHGQARQTPRPRPRQGHELRRVSSLKAQMRSQGQSTRSLASANLINHNLTRYRALPVSAEDARTSVPMVCVSYIAFRYSDLTRRLGMQAATKGMKCVSFSSLYTKTNHY